MHVLMWTCVTTETKIVVPMGKHAYKSHRMKFLVKVGFRDRVRVGEHMVIVELSIHLRVPIGI